MSYTHPFLVESGLSKEELLKDLTLCAMSREVSSLGRKEVFMGKAKFGIFGGGKELPQAVMARFFNKGDFRSGYYRDQTFMFGIESLKPQHLFAQLYAHANIEAEPASGGRMMTGHFSTFFLDEHGEWLDLTELKNSSSDISPTAAQMPRLVGMAYASKLYRQNPALHGYTTFSKNGNEIAFGTIGNASTAEGPFFESFNAGGVLQVPMLVSVWDDDYGISVHSDLQITKGDISAILAGFQRNADKKGYEIFKVKGWDYAALYRVYKEATTICREEHVPVLIHVTELTQPGGHSTSGSHERYKSKERLAWEEEYDCISQFKLWILNEGIATEAEIQSAEQDGIRWAKEAREEAWKSFNSEINTELVAVDLLIENLIEAHPASQSVLQPLRDEMKSLQFPFLSDIVRNAKKAIRITNGLDSPARTALLEWNAAMRQKNHERYSSQLHNAQKDAVSNIAHIPPTYSDQSAVVDGRQIMQACFDAALARDPKVLAFGEDVGRIGDVNQGFAGLQEKYGDLRVIDTGIRECTIIGQAIGLALRGLRPIAEIQYLDYLMYAIQILSDDLATLQYRSCGRQKAPVIIRTRGHRLEGVWHSGSPLGTILHAIRGIHVCVPRNMTQAAGMYNTLLGSGDPGLVIECLNGYRLKETMPDNIGSFTVPLGHCDVLRSGTDITIVTYGSMCRIVTDAAEQLEQVGISCEVIDVQTLIPFDVNKTILESIKKTNRVLFADEDVPGGATAYMMQQVVEDQEAYYYLDSKPKTIHSWAHRPAYSTDGDYFSKPNTEDVFDYVYAMMHEVDPVRYPDYYRQ